MPTRRGPKHKANECRSCGAQIDHTAAPPSRTLKDRVCARCATDRVMLSRWSKKPTEEILQRISQLKHTIQTLEKALKLKGEPQ